MRFLLTDGLGGGVADALRDAGHVPVTPAEAGVAPGAGAEGLREAARRGQTELVVGDRRLLDDLLPGAGLRGQFGRVLVFLQDAPDAHADAVSRLFARYKRLSPGRVYTVTAGRVKVRQLPTDPGAKV